MEDINLLIVDDNMKNIFAMKNILKSLEVNVHSALSGQEALQAVLRYDFAAIFLDIQMPEMDGYEVANCLSSNSETANIPLIFVTAIYDSVPNMLKGYAAGAVDYLLKPIEPKVLRSKAQIFTQLYIQKKKLQQVNTQLQTLASTDALTGLANRHHFNDVFENLLKQAQENEQQFALILIDIDEFKSINDVLGHDVGDELLQSIAQILKKKLDASDHIARLGGDEFGILSVRRSDKKQAISLVEHLLQALDKPLELGGISYLPRASFGIATYPFAGKTSKALYKAADVSLYSAKSKGKHTYDIYSESLSEACRRRFLIEQMLPKAIEKKEIKVHYQPIVNLKTKQVIGVEALVRWQVSNLGIVEPIELMAIAEQTQWIKPLGEYIINLAFEAFVRWSSNDAQLKLHINLSPSQLLIPNFIHDIQQMIQKNNINAAQLRFELTESIFKGQHESLEKVMFAAQKVGFRFIIDNFGTGYSSLSRIKSLPICALKIDRLFIQGSDKDSDAVAIAHAIMALSEALGLDVFAEGVTSSEQVNFLNQLGCFAAQGFHFSNPVEADKVTGLLTCPPWLKGK